MAVSSSTTAITNHDAGTPNQDAISMLGNVRAIPFSHEKLATNTNGDHIQIARVHSDWSVLSIVLNSDALTGATAVDCGLYTDAAPADAAAVDDDCYASAVDIASGETGTELAFEARDVATIGQKVWQDAGLSSRASPAPYYRIALTLDTGGTATGTIAGYVLVATPS